MCLCVYKTSACDTHVCMCMCTKVQLKENHENKHVPVGDTLAYLHVTTSGSKREKEREYICIFIDLNNTT